jgi:hypothetical protein
MAKREMTISEVASKAAKARWAKTTAEERVQRGREMALARWAKVRPEDRKRATRKWWGAAKKARKAKQTKEKQIRRKSTKPP